MTAGLRGWVVVVVLGALAVLLAAVAGGRQELACERASGRCTWTSRAMFTSVERGFAVADVREVRLVEGTGKGARRGHPQLVFASGRDLDLPSAELDTARDRQAALVAFFDGRTGSIRQTGPTLRWMYVLAALAGVAAVIALVRTVGAPRSPRYPKPSRPARDWRRLAFIGGAAVLGCAAILGAQLWFERDDARLALECQTRCRFGTMECLPGGDVTLSAAPGDHVVEVWAPSGPALWIPHTVTLRAGETTRFVCAP